MQPIQNKIHMYFTKSNQVWWVYMNKEHIPDENKQKK